MHKSDTFRMALGAPIIVGRRSYEHGEFRVQKADTFYGPELWNDEIGTNQLLLVADRRGVKPYLADAGGQIHVDQALANDVNLEGITLLGRDDKVDHQVGTNFAAVIHAGHFDAGFDDTDAWPELADGSRVAVIAIGDTDHGPAIVCWDRPPGAPGLPAIELRADLLRLVVTGSCTIGPRALGPLGFVLQQAGSVHDPSTPGPDGSRELWILAGRNPWSREAVTGLSSAVLSGVEDGLSRACAAAAA
ncbi:hypothetical protein K6U06_19875 [Acidiferrimicrobium sp. IK]|uniref:hypothetical protein n=1 Tax=Acidiferrimicrobium sp. IK TaxID=2871700 RepID=UPI0021CB526B|nr:hypothetical protein [Acidiferrimicrobium sp. IK]MCU4186633.1 hypothetical protein [Acidiferrimicrobium sp. IK]